MGGCWAWAVRAGLWPALGQKSGLTLTVRASPTHHSTWTALPPREWEAGRIPRGLLGTVSELSPHV